MCEKYNPDPEKIKDKEEENVLQKIKKKKKDNPKVKLAKPDQWIYDLFSIKHLELKLKIFSFRFRKITFHSITRIFSTQSFCCFID